MILFFVDNICIISNINNYYYEKCKNYNLERYDINNHLTYEDVYIIAREIIEHIDCEYLKDYDNLITSWILDFSYNNEYDDSCFNHFYIDNEYYNTININREFNYTDVITLIHEFIHYINGKDKQTISRHLLTEFFSIYFELYVLDYLMNSGIPKQEIDYKLRLRSTYNWTCDFRKITLPILYYVLLGDITDEHFEMFQKYIGISDKKIFEKQCHKLLNYFNNNDLRCEYGLDYSLHCQYLIGTVLAMYARSYCKKEDIVYMNNHINDNNCDILSSLNKMNIYVNDDDFLLKVFDSIDDYIYDYKIKQR